MAPAAAPTSLSRQIHDSKKFKSNLTSGTLVHDLPRDKHESQQKAANGKYNQQLQRLQRLEPQRSPGLKFRGSRRIWFATLFCVAMGQYFFGSYYPYVGNQYIFHRSSSRTDDALATFGTLE
jgi:hypothetical protein